MQRRLVTFILILLTATVMAENKVHFILTGGPALRKWENLRIEPHRHDRWWANFIRASTLRMVEIRTAYGKDAEIVWAVYKNGYVRRSTEDHKPFTTWIESLAKKRKVKLIWFSKGDQAIAAINKQPRKSIVTFDYFGHSNRFCFLFDYSSAISGASKSWLHEKELYRIRSSVFAKHPISQSWGCYTGESMSKYWKYHVGHTLIGAEGKTNYEKVGRGEMPAINGRWITR